ncbi:hypothetical protein [Alysiella crassa]|uniref:Uncharacterized protein n=1 Tax=Alysiella crassa TaxID=153491 RepID=A0A376BLN9_9NEIS|nr:hypothetical protein [Alysiella crassa]UOP07637.1 hypothetical protein LVJ80_04520 [Alysiella crassa]SSY70134.1 Uncharacterised protein [Alysiella crassa]
MNEINPIGTNWDDLATQIFTAQEINESKLRVWHIESMIAAVIADNPEAASIAESLKTSLQQAQQGYYASFYTPSTITKQAA